MITNYFKIANEGPRPQKVLHLLSSRASRSRCGADGGRGHPRQRIRPQQPESRFDPRLGVYMLGILHRGGRHDAPPDVCLRRQLLRGLPGAEASRSSAIAPMSVPRPRKIETHSAARRRVLAKSSISSSRRRPVHRRLRSQREPRCRDSPKDECGTALTAANASALAKRSSPRRPAVPSRRRRHPRSRSRNAPVSGDLGPIGPTKGEYQKAMIATSTRSCSARSKAIFRNSAPSSGRLGSFQFDKPSPLNRVVAGLDTISKRPRATAGQPREVHRPMMLRISSPRSRCSSHAADVNLVSSISAGSWSARRRSCPQGVRRVVAHAGRAVRDGERRAHP